MRLSVFILITATAAGFLLLSAPAVNAQLETNNTQSKTKITQQSRPGVPVDFESVLDPQGFFEKTFDIFRQHPATRDAADRITQEGAFDEANEAIGERIGINPVDILKAFVRAIIWVLESGVGFFSQLVN